MPNTTTTNLGLVKQTTTENLNTWGGYLNDNWDAIEKVLTSQTTKTLANLPVTLTSTEQACLLLRLQGTLSANVTVTLTNKAGMFIVRNECTMGNFKITIAGASSGSIDVGNAGIQVILTDGVTALSLTSDAISMTEGTVLGRRLGSDGAAQELPIKFAQTSDIAGIARPPLAGYVVSAQSANFGGQTKLDTTLSGEALFCNGFASFEQADSGAASASFMNFNGGTQAVCIFRQGNGAITCGSITVTGASTTSFNTTSDYRVKDDLGVASGALAKVRRLVVRRFRFKSDKKRVHIGFFAHEAQKIAPYAVVGRKDGEAMQQMDYSKMVPLLTAAIQELSNRVVDLEKSK